MGVVVTLVPGDVSSDGEGHTEHLTDGETNGVWNSIGCETHSEGGRVTPTLQYGSDSGQSFIRPRGPSISSKIDQTTRFSVGSQTQGRDRLPPK